MNISNASLLIGLIALSAHAELWEIEKGGFNPFKGQSEVDVVVDLSQPEKKEEQPAPKAEKPVVHVHVKKVPARCVGYILSTLRNPGKMCLAFVGSGVGSIAAFVGLKLAASIALPDARAEAIATLLANGYFFVSMADAIYQIHMQDCLACQGAECICHCGQQKN